MKQLHITLFGKLSIKYGGCALPACEQAKVQELLCYLLLHRDRSYTREMLASLLWGSYCTTALSKKYLRNALWRLQAVFNAQPEIAGSGLLVVEPGWVQLRSVAGLRLDVAAFEAAYTAVRGRAGASLDEQSARTLEESVQLYRGDLLEDCYSEWCLCERERLLQIYLTMLDKLVDYCRAHARYEEGLSYGRGILRYDRARECTHQQMMQLYYLNGDRTGALRQYVQCVDALKEELDVGPARSTARLYQQIREDHLYQPADEPTEGARSDSPARQIIHHLRQLHTSLKDVQLQVQRVTEAAERAFEDPSDTE